MLLLLLLPAVGDEPRPEILMGEVARIVDGDTLTVRFSVDGKTWQEVDVDLHGIDAPEHGQADGEKARKCLSDLALKKLVLVFIVENAGGSRRTGVVFATTRPDPYPGAGYGKRPRQREVPPSVDVGGAMVASGFAWHSKRHAPDDKKLAENEREARKAKRGIWANDTPLPPWEWRATHDQNDAEAENPPLESESETEQ
jgi:endonuclease YncB( thermonuclease family)